MSYPNTYMYNKEYMSLRYQLKLKLCKDTYNDTDYEKEKTHISLYHPTRFKIDDILNDITKKSQEQWTTHSTDQSHTSQMYYKEQRDNFHKSLKQTTQKLFKRILDKIIKNSEIILLEYDMFDEFKNHNPSYNDFYSNTNYNIELSNDIIYKFINDVISCCLSQDADIKRNKKYEIQRQKRIKEQQLIKQKEQEYKENLYKKEFKCMILFNKIEKNKFASEEIYLEYNKILELKKIYSIPKNILFLIKYIRFLNKISQIFINKN